MLKIKILKIEKIKISLNFCDFINNLKIKIILIIKNIVGMRYLINCIWFFNNSGIIL